MVVAGCAALFAVVAGLLLSWDQLFPVPDEDRVEVAWTHGCSCAHPWMESLRASGFIVQDHEMDSLVSSRRRWHVPESAQGCHPAHYLTYALDGHVPPALLRRLALERPPGVALVQLAATNDPQHAGNPHFEIHDARGLSRPWP